MKNKEELLIKQAKEGYTVCYIDQCPLHNQCLRWLVGQHMPQTASTYRCVNPHFEGVATADCPMYRNDQKVRFAKGMMNIFTNLQQAIRDLFRTNGWTDEVKFDGYVEDYDW